MFCCVYHIFNKHVYEPYVDNDIYNSDKKVPFFTFNGYSTYGKVVHIYDGDTIHVVVKMIDSNNIVKLRVRLNGIDTPEIRIATQKEDAIKAKEKLESLLNETENIVYIKFNDFDKYGRVLAYLYSTETSQKSINQLLIEGGYAKEYHGGTKQ